MTALVALEWGESELTWSAGPTRPGPCSPATGTGRVNRKASSSTPASFAAEGAAELLSGTIMRTVALAPRFRRKGSGPSAAGGGSLAEIGETEAALGAPIEGGALEGLDDPIAGKPIIVFLRGGRVEYGLTLGGASAEGGGVTMEGGAADTPCGGMKP